MSNIWWAYDESSGSFSALPASPALLPALGVFFLAAVFSAGKEKPRVIETYPDGNPYMGEHLANKPRYDELINIMGYRELTDKEQSELHRLKHPRWAKDGEVWCY